jgi:hypothetical protein
MIGLYESILGDQEEQIKQSAKLCGDMFDVRDVHINNDAYTEYNLARFFKWAEVKKYCQKNNLKIPSGWKAGELPAIFKSLPYIGYAQNFLTVMKTLLRSGFKMTIEEIKPYKPAVHSTHGMVNISYKIEKPTGDPEDILNISIWLVCK